MSEKDRLQQEQEENDAEVTELDSEDLEDVAGGINLVRGCGNCFCSEA